MARVVPGSEVQAVVVFVTRIINGEATPLPKPRILMHAPAALPQQDITELDVEGTPDRLADRWGCPVLRYERQELAPGTSLVGRWTARATVRRLRWDFRGKGGSGAELSPEERALSLRNVKQMALDDPVIEKAAAEAARGRTGTVEVLDGIFGLVMDRLTYERDGKWQPAPEVLSRGKGSCSEYTYCFMALCRRSGIPTRYVGGLNGRLNEPFYLDRVFHRFSQAYLPQLGWVDFDPTRTERARNKRLYFGQTPGPMLLLSIGDGGKGSLTGTDYLESHSWAKTKKKARVSSLREAWWFPPPKPEVRNRVERFRRRLGSAVAAERLALVDEALSIGHPFVLPWLDDLLYEPGARVAAAGACLKLGGDGELGAIVNCLGRLNDAEGDRQIGGLLDQFTGEAFGPSRAKWNEWLKTRPPRTRPPAGDSEKK